MSFPNPGIHFGVSERDYFRTGKGFISKSLLWAFEPNPHKWFFGPAKETTKAMEFGSAVDALWLTPNSFAELCAVSPYVDYRKKEAQEWRDETRAIGKIVLTQSELEEIHACCSALNANAFCHSIRYEGGVAETQVSVVTEGKSEGQAFKAKARIDLLPAADGPFGNEIWDLKTTGSISDLSKTIWERGYHVQAAWYLDTFNAQADKPRDGFGFIFVESEAPYEIAVVRLDADAIAEGRRWYASAVAKWLYCEKTGNYPSPWEDEIKTISLPRWSFKN